MMSTLFMFTDKEISAIFQKEDIQRGIKELLSSVSAIVYDEIYVYIWLMCFYHVFLIFLMTVTIVILIRQK